MRKMTQLTHSPRECILPDTLNVVLGKRSPKSEALFLSGVGMEEQAMPQSVLGVLSGRPWYHWVFISLLLVVLARLLQRMARILRSG